MPMIPRNFASAGSGGNVPDTFAPDVTQGETPMSPASSPWVSPMKNAAPGLLQQTGAALSRAGDTAAALGNTIGDRVQEMMDDAQTKSAETQFLSTVQPLVSQYRTTEGMNAVNQFGPTSEAIVKAGQDARAGLANPVQQRMFDQIRNDHLLTLGSQMADHESTQRLEYAKAQSNDRIGTMNTQAVGAYLSGDQAGAAKYGQTADTETQNLAQLGGAAPDSDVAAALLRTQRSSRARGIVAGLLDRHAVDEAGQYFDQVRSGLDINTASALDNAIKSGHMQEDPKVLGQRAVMAAKGITGPGMLQPPIPAGTITTTQGENGIDIHTAPGTKVMAPASGTVTKVWNDEASGGGLTLQMQLPNGYTAQFNHLSAANYQEGQKITVGQALGLSGKDATGQGVTQYAMTGPDGKAIDPRQASSAPMDPRNFSAPEDEEKAVEWVNKNVADPDMQKLTEGYVRGIANTNRQIENQEHSAALKQATDYWYDHGYSIDGLPADVKMKLRPGDVDSFSQEAQAGAEKAKAKNDVNMLANWIQNPQTMTVDAVRTAYAQNKLSDAGYLTAMRGAMKVQGANTGSTDPQKVRAVTVDHNQLTDIFNANQLPNLAFPKEPADKMARIQMETAIKDEIDVQQQRNNRPLTWEEKGKIARDMTIDKVYTSTPWAMGSGTLEPAAALTADEMKQATVFVGNQKVRMADIPPQYAKQATQQLEMHGVPSTQTNIAAWWLRKGKPTQ